MIPWPLNRKDYSGVGKIRQIAPWPHSVSGSTFHVEGQQSRRLNAVWPKWARRTKHPLNQRVQSSTGRLSDTGQQVGWSATIETSIDTCTSILKAKCCSQLGFLSAHTNVWCWSTFNVAYCQIAFSNHLKRPHCCRAKGHSNYAL